ncbi:MAG: ABC transporter ATP-binding protein, partial [Actinophytocola sp.]
MPERRTAVLLALRYYWRELASRKRITLPALFFPAVGNICIQYVTPLIVAGLAGRLIDGMPVKFATVAPWVLGFAGVLLVAEILWRIGIHCLNRTDGLGIERLY